MKLPFPHWMAKTNIKVILTDGLTEDGEPAETTIFEGKCIYSEKLRRVMDAERRLITLSGKAIIEGDIAPGQAIDGYVQITPGMIKQSIHQAARPRNPDGSVYSTELELI